jgi:hypothetical protein
MEAAERRTGLTGFGDTNVLEALRRLLDSCNNEACPNGVGRLVCTEDILQLLCNRLEIERDVKSFPGYRHRRDYSAGFYHRTATERNHLVT